MASFELPAAVERWIEDGRDDAERFMANGFGIRYHSKQVEVLQALAEGQAAIYLLDWANRAGKTTLLFGFHAHALWYKLGVIPARTPYDYRNRWLPMEYRTLHAAPLNELAGAAWTAWGEILKGTSPAQRDLETGEQRPAPLGPLFQATRERDETGSDHSYLRCLNGAVTDFRSTEGGGSRLEARAWRRISWDEWCQQENVDDIESVVLPRLVNRASDFEAPVVLTGTLTPETEHIAKAWERRAEDPEDPDWWVNHAERWQNPITPKRSIERAERILDPEDFARTVLGLAGGVKDRLFADYLVEHMLDKDLPRFTPPHERDGVTRGVDDIAPDGPPRVWLREGSPWTYLHVWDLALAAAENAYICLRAPRSWEFGPSRPLLGVATKVIPGSRSLTSAEIIHTIEESYLPYGGLIVLDTTDAHGKNIERELRNAGYPVMGINFNERLRSGVTRKDQMIVDTKKVLSDGMDPELGPKTRTPWGSLRIPAAWLKVRDQMSVLRVDNDKQRKDFAMAVLMGCSVAYRKRRSTTNPIRGQRFRVFGRR